MFYCNVIFCQTNLDLFISKPFLKVEFLSIFATLPNVSAQADGGRSLSPIPYWYRGKNVKDEKVSLSIYLHSFYQSIIS